MRSIGLTQSRIAAILLACCAANAPAPFAVAMTRLSYEDAARVALGSNPDLGALREQEEALKFRSRQAIAPGNPFFYVNKYDLPGPAPLSQGASTQYGLQFTLGFPGKALAVSAQQARSAESVREQSLAKEVELLISLSNIYAALTTNKNLNAILDDEKHKAHDVVRLLERKYTLAQASQVDLLNARVVEVGLEQQQLTAEGDARTLVTQFLAVIKRPERAGQLEPLIPADVVVPTLSFTVEELDVLLKRNRHPLKAASLQREAAEKALLVASLSPLPDFQLKGEMNIYHIPSAEPVPGMSRDYNVGIGISVPIFFPLNELTGIHAAMRDRDAAEDVEQSHLVSSLSDLHSAVTKLESTRRQRENMAAVVLPAAKASYDLALKSYSLGRADYLSLNLNRTNFIQAQKDHLNLKLAEAQLYNQVTQLVGCDFSRREGPHACH